MKKLLLLIVPLLTGFLPAQAQNFSFKHIVIIVQENRTPDNLFYTLCNNPSLCSDIAESGKYDIQTSPWQSKLGPVQPVAIPLADPYDIRHSHQDFLAMCDGEPANLPTSCRMDGAEDEQCIPQNVNTPCPPMPEFAYVSDSRIQNYLTLATSYGWANLMFQSNQGPSFPAHQFLFGATSAPSAMDDANGNFAAENYRSDANGGGCLSPNTVFLINQFGVEYTKIPPCFEHKTLADLLTGSGPSNVGWKYYATFGGDNSFGFGVGDYWDAPLAIAHLCEPIVKYQCAGPAFVGSSPNDDDGMKSPGDALSDIQNCNLRGVTWITPSGAESDHAQLNDGTGPDWVSNVVNAIGTSCGFWKDTAIILTWDDWGGWYDHEGPTILPSPEGYQYGFRVPMIFISAYTSAGTINNNRMDFGAIANFVETNFGLGTGALGFADARTTETLSEFVDAPYRAFVPLPLQNKAGWYIHDKRPKGPPDND